MEKSEKGLNVKVIIFIIAAVFIACAVWVFVTSSFTTEKVEQEATPALEESDLGEYMKTVSYTKDRKVEDMNILSAHVEADKEFSYLTKQEKFEAMADAVEVIKYLDLDCNQNCKVTSLTVNSNEMKHQMEFDYVSNLYTLELVMDGHDPLTYNDITGEEEEEEDSTLASSGEEETSDYASSYSDTEIYNYMKQAYDQVIGADGNYLPAIHDPQVAEMASQRFGISAQEAGDLYVQMEVNTYERSQTDPSVDSSANYNIDGEYQPVEDMTPEEIEEELTRMLEDGLGY